jgi:NTE family protein
MPKAWETLFASHFIFERTIILEKLRHRHPDLYIDAGTSHFQILDFLKVDEILAAAEPAKERVKAQLTRMLESETLPDIEALGHEAKAELPAPGSRRLLLRRRKAKG